MTRDEALARQDLAQMLETIGRARGLHPHGKMFPCPCADHEQTGATPPVSLAPEPAGYDVWHCHSCGKGGTAIDALVYSGMEPDMPTALKSLGIDDEPQPRIQPSAPKHVAEYVYHDAEGNPHLRVVRLEPKSFRQQRWEDGRWQWGLGDTQRVLYHLPDVLAAKKRGEWVFIVEGEKDADAVREAGFCATCNVGGAGKWEDSYTEALTGARVVIIADDDEPGRLHATRVYQALYGKARVGIRLPAEGHKDIADHLSAGLKMNGDLRKAPDLEARNTQVPRARAAMTAATFMQLPTTSGLQVLGPLFQRGMRTVIGAGTGEGKTTLGLQAIAALVHGKPFLDETWRPKGPGLRALIIDLEQGKSTLQRRLRESGLAESERVEILWEPNGIALDSREEDRAWVEDTIRDGQFDLVLIDPLYQSHTGSGNDEQVAAATMRVVDGWARDYNIAVVVPMHARKPGVTQDGKEHRFTKHDIAGVRTWLNNAEFILGLQMKSAGYSQLYFFKDREGDGPEQGSHWGLTFDREAGFRRSFAEDRQAAARILTHLVAREEGASWDELIAVPGAVIEHLGADGLPYAGPGSIPNLLRKCEEVNGRWFKKAKGKKKTVVPDGQTQIEA